MCEREIGCGRRRPLVDVYQCLGTKATEGNMGFPGVAEETALLQVRAEVMGCIVAM